MEHLSLYPVVVPDTFDSWVKWFATLKIDSDSVSISLFLLRRVRSIGPIDAKKERARKEIDTDLQSDDSILDVKATVRCQSLRNDKKSLSKRLNTHLDPSLGVLLYRSGQVSGACDFESTSTGNE